MEKRMDTMSTILWPTPNAILRKQSSFDKLSF